MEFVRTTSPTWTCSSDGRASALHAEGRRFESVQSTSIFSILSRLYSASPSVKTVEHFLLVNHFRVIIDNFRDGIRENNVPHGLVAQMIRASD